MKERSPGLDLVRTLAVLCVLVTHAIAYTGVNAGMVIAVADDAGMHSSQNEQDSRHYARASKIPMLEPSDSSEALAFTQEDGILTINTTPFQYGTDLVVRVAKIETK